METHGGRGLYDLSSEETAKTHEAAEGIALLSPDPGTPFGQALGAAKARGGPQAYPGSPLVAEALLRPQDRLVLMEAHPKEHAGLKRTMRGTIAEVHRRNGYEGSLALAPLEPRRGLVLIDPSYEDKTEYERAGRHTLALRKKWPEAAVLIWYPLLKAGRHKDLLGVLEGDDSLVSEVSFSLKEGRGMTGSGLVLLGAPYGADAAFERALAQGTPVLKPLR
ncbi:23S rRNA (adenine(2030)-N(6))-methyltransferase RlmJ [Parvularcula maris]|uniref:23S rRNA (Adenine(2030)-N(6))-methyltransferase RlmJ n=1 Tax=Parvularcula maris TaxID=2965077 RepID=A0A9X2LBP5_9PROT|nr:23S rRNA (adenine(2030)-N(6))-methyltransferase RlmJ [Parvularcula maris]MCQ8186596.1 23S rRNA (adenine(2030)-N(6))-methyltransferase RlmJ [Parvularcula maris]